MTEYVEGIYKQDLATVEGEIKLAESELSRSADRVDWAQRMFLKGYVSLAQKVSEDLALKKARFALEQAQSKKKVLVDYTRDKTIKELESDVKKALSDELAKKATHELEAGKEKKLVRQIDACSIVAPSDGLVVYANDPTRAFMSNTPQVEEGAQVRERQKIFSLPDISKMQVNTKVHESHIKNVKPGMKAKIRVDAFSNDLLDGEVTDVAALPDTASMFSSDIKVYTTKVRINSKLTGAASGHERRGDDPGQPARQGAHGAGDGGARVRREGLRDQEGRRPVCANGDRTGPLEREIRRGEEGRQGGRARGDEPGLADDRGREAQRLRLGGQVHAPRLVQGRERRGGGHGHGQGAPGPGGAPGAGKMAGAAAKGKASGKARGKGAGGGFFAKMKNLSSEDREQMKTASPEEKAQLLKKAGLTDEEIEQMAERMKNFGGGGGRGMGGGGGRGRGGFGGGEGGSDQ